MEIERGNPGNNDLINSDGNRSVVEGPQGLPLSELKTDVRPGEANHPQEGEFTSGGNTGRGVVQKVKEIVRTFRG